MNTLRRQARELFLILFLGHLISSCASPRLQPSVSEQSPYLTTEAATEELAKSSLSSQMKPSRHQQAWALLQAITDRLNGHGAKIAAPVPVESEVLNAISLPNHTILVTESLMALAQSEDALAFVLAHEWGHKKLNHFRDVEQKTLVELSLSPEFAKNRRESEMAADREGLKLMVAAGYHPDGATEFFEQLRFYEASHFSASSGILATHPGTEERILKVSEWAKENVKGARTQGASVFFSAWKKKWRDEQVAKFNRFDFLASLSPACSGGPQELEALKWLKAIELGVDLWQIRGEFEGLSKRLSKNCQGDLLKKWALATGKLSVFEKIVDENPNADWGFDRWLGTIFSRKNTQVGEIFTQWEALGRSAVCQGSSDCVSLWVKYSKLFEGEPSLLSRADREVSEQCLQSDKLSTELCAAVHFRYATATGLKAAERARPQSARLIQDLNQKLLREGETRLAGLSFLNQEIEKDPSILDSQFVGIFFQLGFATGSFQNSTNLIGRGGTWSLGFGGFVDSVDLGFDFDFLNQRDPVAGSPKLSSQAFKVSADYRLNTAHSFHPFLGVTAGVLTVDQLNEDELYVRRVRNSVVGLGAINFGFDWTRRASGLIPTLMKAKTAGDFGIISAIRVVGTIGKTTASAPDLRADLPKPIKIDSALYWQAGLVLKFGLGEIRQEGDISRLLGD